MARHADGGTGEAAAVERLLAAERARIDEVLAARLERRRGALGKAVRYSALAPGKRLRPLLTVTAFRACGGRGDAVYPAAAALELVHAYSLVHDDLPDFDDDALRRGRPTSHVVHGEPLALAAGFALLAEGLTWLAEIAPPADRELLRVVTRAAGLDGMIGGQWLDLVGEGRAAGEAELVRIHRGKTGRLIEAAVAVGALLAGAGARARAALAVYGAELGLAFQIADDLLDAEGDERRTGKTTGTDAAAGKTTFVSVHGVAGARAHARGAAERAKAALAGADLEPARLRALADFVADRAH